MIRTITILLCSTFLTAQLYATPICIKSAGDKCFIDPYPPISSSNPLDIFDRTSDLVWECFYDQSFPTVDWKKEAAAAKKEISATSSEKELSESLSRLLKKLNASHTEFFGNFDQRYWALKSVFSGIVDGAALFQVGAMFSKQESRWFAASVFEGSPAWNFGLRRGDEIVSVDGKPLSPVHSFAKSSCARVQYRKSLKGKLVNVCLPPSYESFQRSMLNGSRLSKQIFFGKKRVGYFHLWAGTHVTFKNSLANVAREMQRKADALILDIRDGLGGADPSFLDSFLKQPSPVFSKPLFVLINEGSKSGKETLAYLFKKTGRAKLIGTKTAGYYLGGRLFDILANQFILYLAICGDSPVEAPIEGVGIEPDVEIENPLPYSHGTDLQLQAALRMANE